MYCHEHDDDYGLYIDYYLGSDMYGESCAHLDAMLSMEEGIFDGGAHDAMQLVLQRKMAVTLIKEYHKQVREHTQFPGYIQQFENMLKKAEGRLLMLKSEKLEDGVYTPI